jgi:hypothetical protein
MIELILPVGCAEFEPAKHLDLRMRTSTPASKAAALQPPMMWSTSFCSFLTPSPHAPGDTSISTRARERQQPPAEQVKTRDRNGQGIIIDHIHACSLLECVNIAPVPPDDPPFISSEDRHCGCGDFLHVIEATRWCCRDLALPADRRPLGVAPPVGYTCHIIASVLFYF